MIFGNYSPWDASQATIQSSEQTFVRCRSSPRSKTFKKSSLAGQNSKFWGQPSHDLSTEHSRSIVYNGMLPLLLQTRRRNTYSKAFLDRSIIVIALSIYLFHALLLTHQKFATSTKAVLEAMGDRWIDKIGSKNSEGLEDLSKSSSADMDKSNPVGSPRSLAALYTKDPAVTYLKATHYRDTLFVKSMLHIFDNNSLMGHSTNLWEDAFNETKKKFVQYIQQSRQSDWEAKADILELAGNKRALRVWEMCIPTLHATITR